MSPSVGHHSVQTIPLLICMLDQVAQLLEEDFSQFAAFVRLRW